MAEFALKIINSLGVTCAQTLVFGDTEQELAEGIVRVAEDFQNGDSDWLEGACDE